jgi:hypothetical protein
VETRYQRVAREQAERKAAREQAAKVARKKQNKIARDDRKERKYLNILAGDHDHSMDH